MSDPVMALKGASFEGLVSVEEQPVQGMITLRGDFSSPVFAEALRSATGCDLPDVRSVSEGNAGSVLWMSSDELFLLCNYGSVEKVMSALEKSLGNEHALVVDVSDARAMFSLKGKGVREVLAKVTPADLRPNVLPVGELRRSRLAQVAGAFWFSDTETAYVICFRSVAPYVFELLTTAGKSGTDVEYF